MFLLLFPVFFLLGKHVYENYFSRKVKPSVNGTARQTNPPPTKEPVRFYPPAYIQRYQTVVEILEDPKFEGKLRKIVDFGCSELGFLPHLKNVKGVEEVICVDVDAETLERYEKQAKPLTADYLKKRSAPFVVEICEGCVTQNDKILENADAVICIELIEHLHPSTLQRVPSNIFGYIRPKLVIITTPNADFNVVFDNLSGFRHPDHKFEWTREEFQNWAKNIVNEYPFYTVTFHGICNGPEWTKEFGACTQMAIFQLESQEEMCKKKRRGGVEGLYVSLFRYEYPYKIDTRSDEQKLLDEAVYYINYLATNDTENTPKQEILLREIAFLMTKFSPSEETLRTVLENAGWLIIDKEHGPTIIMPENYDADYDSNHENDEFDDDELDWDIERIIENETHEDVLQNYNEDWDAEPSIIIPQNHSIVQENTYLFDGEILPEECHASEEVRSYDNDIDDDDRYSSIIGSKERALSTEQELPSNSLPTVLNGTKRDNITRVLDSNALSKIIKQIQIYYETNPNNLEGTTKNVLVDNDMNTKQSVLSQDISCKTKQRHPDSIPSSSPKAFLSHLSISRSSTSPGALFRDELDDSLHNCSASDQDEPYNSQHLFNSTFKESQTTETDMNIENLSTDVLGVKELALEDDNIQNLIQDTNEEYAGEEDTINREIDVMNDVQRIDEHRVLSSNDVLKHKEENVCCASVTAVMKADDAATEAHLETVIIDLAQSNKSERSLSSSRELLSSQNDNEFTSAEYAKETYSLDDTFISCESNEATDNTVVKFASVLKNDEYVGCDIEDPMNKDVNISNTASLADNVEANPRSSSALETPPDSLSHEIMDSGYPNSASVQDITPENDLSSIAQDHIPDIESPSVAEAPRFGILEPIEVENGDLANNNRDDEGNNMMAVDANDIEGLQPLIDVLENDLENENDIYVLENGFPMWLLNMANPLDFDMPPQQNLGIPNVADGNYIGNDEGFDSSSDGSDVANNESDD